MLQPDDELPLRERPGDPVRPLDEERPLSAHEVPEARRVELVLVRDPVEVGVMDGDPAAVRRDDGEARRGDLLRPHPRAGAGAADELGLARAEVAHQRDDVGGTEEPPELRAERVGRPRRARDEARRGPFGHRPHSAHT
jgi:hypothetical protein